MADLDDDVMFEEVDERPVEKPAAPFWTVAIYLVDQAYGGPEEGGWWYQTGERVDHALDGFNPNLLLTVFHGDRAEDQAVYFSGAIQKLLDAGPNAGRRDISSVLSTGRYQAQVHNGHPPQHYPERRPHYE